MPIDAEQWRAQTGLFCASLKSDLKMQILCMYVCGAVFLSLLQQCMAGKVKTCPNDVVVS